MKPNGKPPVRQGDILLIPTDDVPRNRTLIAPVGGRIILAAGETTGHHHAITLDRPDSAELYDVADEVDRWLRVRTPVFLQHQEHTTIVIDRNYIVRRQREYAPGEIRRVVD